MTEFTEEDTFDALRRRSFAEVFLYCTRGMMIGQWLGEGYEDYLKSAGWTKEDLFKEVNDRQIGLDVIKLNDNVWREEFAKNDGRCDGR